MMLGLFLSLTTGGGTIGTKQEVSIHYVLLRNLLIGMTISVSLVVTGSPPSTE